MTCQLLTAQRSLAQILGPKKHRARRHLDDLRWRSSLVSKTAKILRCPSPAIRSHIGRPLKDGTTTVSLYWPVIFLAHQLPFLLWQATSKDTLCHWRQNPFGKELFVTLKWLAFRGRAAGLAGRFNFKHHMVENRGDPRIRLLPVWGKAGISSALIAKREDGPKHETSCQCLGPRSGERRHFRKVKFSGYGDVKSFTYQVI